MNKSILFVIFLWVSSAAFSQNRNSEKSLDELNGFMNLHISPGATSVMGYNLTLKRKVLDKETLLFDGKSHHKTFKLTKKAVIEIKYFDFTAPYWEVSIKGDWFHTELQTLEDAEKLVSILKELQSSL